jgi:Ca-activated chloride channel homolog
VLTAPVASGLGRVVLLSDGQANVGIVDPAAIAEDVARVTADGVTTSTIGLGRHFDERMMRHLADAGHGSYTFVESPDGLEGLFETELAGISALRGRA